MQIKAVLLLVVIGAVAVFAKKGSSEEEGGDYTSPQVLEVIRPEQRPFKAPNQVIFLGNPTQPIYTQAAKAPLQISPWRVQQYFLNIQRQMQGFSEKAYNHFQRVESEIDQNKNEQEEKLKAEFQALELSMEAQQNKKIQEAVSNGSDRAKIEECLAEEESNFRASMNADIQNIYDCMNDATDRAKNILKESRNSFTETSIMTSFQARKWAMTVRSCAEKYDVRCVQQGVALIDKKIKNCVEEGSRHFQNIEDGVQKQKIQLDYCRQNFMDDLEDMKTGYSTMTKRCIAASKPEEEQEV